MVEHYQSRPGVLEADPGLPSILDLLQSEYAIIQELTLKTLHSCLHNGNDIHVQLALSGGLDMKATLDV